MKTKIYTAFEETYEERIISTIPEMTDHIFSSEFNKKMELIIKPNKISKKITAKRLWVCITAAVIAATILAVNVGAIRDFFHKFFMEVFSTHTTVQSNEIENTPEHISDKFAIELSDDFALSNTFESDIMNRYEYINGSKYIFFSQTVKSVYDVNVNTENHSLEYVSVNGNDGYLIDLGNEEFYISWDSNNYMFEITGNIGKNELISIAESVHKVE